MNGGTRGRPALSPALGSLLASVVGFATQRDLRVYVVGGFVRDCILGKAAADLDLVWVGAGDPAAVSSALGEHLATEITYHSEFLTASCLVEGVRVDLGRARAETYRGPATLPEVRPGSLTEDLERRDFSVNAIAWPAAAALSGACPGEADVVDPCGGRSDLAAGRLRVLHSRSFIDDPTRILRGLELQARRSLRFEPRTLELAVEAIRAGCFALLSGARVRNELERLLRPPGLGSAARSLRELGLDRALVASFAIDAAGLERLEALAEGGLEPHGTAAEALDWLAALTLLAWDQALETRRALAVRLHLTRAQSDLLVAGPDRVQSALDALTAVDWSPMAAARQCADLTRAESLLLDLLLPRAAAPRWAETASLLSLKLRIGGGDLVTAGRSPGPEIAQALERTLEARRRGTIGADQELDYALGWLEGRDAEAE